MTYVFTFLASVGAGIAANLVYDLICKWLDSRKK